VKVLVINYGMGNLGSVTRALEECGAAVQISDDAAALSAAERIVLPGVGAFPDAMGRLNAANWPSKLAEALRNPQVRLLGICLGMQLLADKSHEVAETNGLGLIRGEVVRLRSDQGERIPHVGWNEVRHGQTSHPLFANIGDGTDFYFVHSYFFRANHAPDVLATTPYCGQFASVVGVGNVFGTQFHPEKSSRSGMQLLRNFLARP
jgi:glutamine amidotransferase